MCVDAFITEPATKDLLHNDCDQLARPDLPFELHSAAIKASAVDTPFGAM
jgi:hypothetical protein